MGFFSIKDLISLENIDKTNPPTWFATFTFSTSLGLLYSVWFSIKSLMTSSTRFIASNDILTIEKVQRAKLKKCIVE